MIYFWLFMLLLTSTMMYKRLADLKFDLFWTCWGVWAILYDAYYLSEELYRLL